MGWWQEIQLRRMRGKFDRAGTDLKIIPQTLEVKGHVEAGNNVTIRGNVVLRTHKLGLIKLGHDVELGDYVLFQCNERVEIGDGTYIGPYVVVRDTNHLFYGTDVHWRLTPHDTRPIVVGARCYVGAGCYIMPGVTIGDGAIIAPRSIITKDVGSLEVWGGSPAKKIAHRLDTDSQQIFKRHKDWLVLFGLQELSDTSQMPDSSDTNDEEQ